MDDGVAFEESGFVLTSSPALPIVIAERSRAAGFVVETPLIASLARTGLR